LNIHRDESNNPPLAAGAAGKDQVAFMVRALSVYRKRQTLMPPNALAIGLNSSAARRKLRA